jgi:hypothetical protein
VSLSPDVMVSLSNHDPAITPARVAVSPFDRLRVTPREAQRNALPVSW